MRVSTAEKEAFRLAAEESQQELSVWVRIQLHKAAGEELMPIETTRPTGDGAKNAEHGKSSADSVGFV